MGAQLTTTTPDTPVEEAALLMLEKNIGCLPVVEGDVLVGIISDRDIFRALVDITGVRHGGHRVCVTVAGPPGLHPRGHRHRPSARFPPARHPHLLREGAEGDRGAW